MNAFYNEIDPYAAAWLRNLIAAGLIAPGHVDERDIRDIDPDELRGFAQCHFFAGIGVWSYALRLAGWPDDRPVWTGSCPCQPFSAAGKREGHQDERHLWPAWLRLIGKRAPAIVFGEQVASADGRAWLDVVLSDLEDHHYAVGAADLPAAGVGAPHIRQRLFFVAHADESRGGRDAGTVSRAQAQAERGVRSLAHGAESDGAACGMGNAGSGGRSGREPESSSRDRASRGERGAQTDRAARPGSPCFWSAADWIACRDGKARPVEPGTFPLAHGAAARVGRLRAYGNAIVAPVAAVFIKAASGLNGRIECK